MREIKEPDGPFYILSKPLTPDEHAELVEFIANHKREEAAKEAAAYKRTATAKRRKPVARKQAKGARQH